MVEYQLVSVKGVMEVEIPVAIRALIVSERIVSGC